MLEQNKSIFDEFKKLHDEYALNPDTLQKKYNEKGKKVMEIVRLYEDRLCGHAEGSGYAAYSGNLAEKFQQEVRRVFPKIDWIGVKVTKTPNFEIKKINL
ncbi:MAG: hypothetical protein US96_C0010G0009 [Candidatus Woesebacteria bacterium GW2011_GWB1_38_5b]|uniref:Uncharacterized protein n=1 Tax=Candidatus Woesebacteria bacterium GW2011_GWB1_38_5b TaxID=1618569 RepID=A0A0G0K724_9BACT|nr:MAG: hypothetical protein US96_C0010G0009 [Candidatus Woesebacteria bacterium GW2011_GWB1_38_5b]